MKHWHRCRRWQRRNIACPLQELDEHEDPDEEDSQLQFIRTTKGRVPPGDPVPVRPGVAPRGQLVRVGDRARTGGIHQRAASATRVIPEPSFPGFDVADLPTPGIGRAAIDRVSEGIAVMPERWNPTDAELAEVMERVGGFRRGELTYSNAVAQISEEAAAESIQVEIGNAETSVPGWLFGIPLVHEALRRIVSHVRAAPTQPSIRDPRPHVRTRKTTTVPTRSGSKGRRGRSRPSESAYERHRRLNPDLKPRTGAAMRPRTPARSGGFGGLNVNMTERMNALIGRGNRQRLADQQPQSSF